MTMQLKELAAKMRQETSRDLTEMLANDNLAWPELGAIDEIAELRQEFPWMDSPAPHDVHAFRGDAALTSRPSDGGRNANVAAT